MLVNKRLVYEFFAVSGISWKIYVPKTGFNLTHIQRCIASRLRMGRTLTAFDLTTYILQGGPSKF